MTGQGEDRGGAGIMWTGTVIAGLMLLIGVPMAWAFVSEAITATRGLREGASFYIATAVSVPVVALAGLVFGWRARRAGHDLLALTWIIRPTWWLFAAIVIVFFGRLVAW